jgi:hypothetical protein
MIRLWFLSDLHLEAVPYPDAFDPARPEFEVLIAAGDIDEGGSDTAMRFQRFGPTASGCKGGRVVAEVSCPAGSISAGFLFEAVGALVTPKECLKVPDGETSPAAIVCRAGGDWGLWLAASLVTA